MYSAFIVYSHMGLVAFRGFVLLPLYPAFRETNFCAYLWVNEVTEGRFGRWLDAIQQYLTDCFTSLARNRTLTAGVLASSEISLPVVFDSIFEHVEFRLPDCCPCLLDVPFGRLPPQQPEESWDAGRGAHHRTGKSTNQSMSTV